MVGRGYPTPTLGLGLAFGPSDLESSDFLFGSDAYGVKYNLDEL